MLTQLASSAPEQRAPALTARFLTPDDIPALMRLEARQWNHEQAADALVMRRRIETHPQLCLGSFCPRTGEALASLFMKPIAAERIVQARNWHECAALDDGARDSGTRSLFGISLTSVDGAASWALIRFFWPHALRAGWRDIYLGSPLPGLARALRDEPSLAPASYAEQTRWGLPVDPQLRYYHRRGFRELVGVRADYFPHAESLDHGALLRGVIPLSHLGPLWRRMPLTTLQAMSGLVAQMLDRGNARR